MTDSELITALRTLPALGLGRENRRHPAVEEAADRIEQRSLQLTEAVKFWEKHRATLDTIKAALDTYDKDPHPADPHVLFAFVEAVARAVRT